jgi:hypothetical protein
MSSSNPSQGPLDAFLRPNTPSNAGSNPRSTPKARSHQHPSQTLQPPTAVTSRSPSPTKRAREENDSESDSEDDEEDEEDNEDADAMDFQPTDHITETQAIGEDTDNSNNTAPQMAAPLSPEHAALRADIEIITSGVLEQFARTIFAEISELFAKNNTALQISTNSLTKQITSLSARVTQMQQQLLSAGQGPAAAGKLPGGNGSTSTNPRKEKKRKEKRVPDNSPNNNNPATNTGPNTHTYADALRTPATHPHPPTDHTKHATNVEGWENLRKRSQGKKAVVPKLIPTMYPQAEREVTCHFPSASPAEAAIHAERNHTARQVIADAALHRVNKALVDNQDVTAPPFLRARVTMRGSIIFTTSNTQNNIIYEDYTTIIADALSYYGKCEKVEIGKRFSQFLLHGVPTHLSIPDISDSIATNYPQLVQCQTPRWLTPADRREHKATSTIVMTLTGSTKKADIGRQYLTICNRECQLDEYISYGRSTQCRNCQGYGHPAALCKNPSRCAVCAEAHETKDHPCTIPACKRGPACTHPPINCANCDAPHKASDPNCPTRIKIRSSNNNTNTMVTTNPGDAPMAGVTE